MGTRILLFSIFLLLAGISWYLDQTFVWHGFEQITQSALSIAVLYGLTKILLETTVVRRIKDAKSAYRIRKMIGLFFYGIVILALFRIWIENPEALLVSYGIVAAGAAIALQDLFKNLAGGMVVVLNNLFQVGDRIEFDGMFGDVIDIGLMNTTMFEIGNWVDGDQATGRVITIPNGVFLAKQVMNYTRDHDFIWDEIFIPLTYDSDWKKASKVFQKIAKRRTDDFIEPAERQLRKMARTFYVTERDASPQIFLQGTDNWIGLRLRYVTHAKERRLVANDIVKSILRALDRHADIKIASETIDIIGFPGAK